MWRKWYIAIPLLIGLLFIAVWMARKHVDEFATAMGCTDHMLSTVNSPDGRYTAFVFRRECGATAPDSTQANVQPIGASLKSEKYKAFVVVGGAPGLNLRWDNANQLVVSGIAAEHIYRQESIVDGIRVRYEAPPKPGPALEK